MVTQWGVLELNLRHSCPSQMAASGSDSNDIEVVQSAFSLDDFGGINIPTVANSRLPLCHH